MLLSALKQLNKKQFFSSEALENYYHHCISNLNENEKKALHAYQGIDYELINMCLRNPSQFKQNAINFQKKALKLIVNIDSAFSKIKTPKELIVYRGIAESGCNAFAKKRHPFRVIDPGFTSTTLSAGKALSFCRSHDSKLRRGMLLKIHIPKGTPAIWMDALDDIDEHEFLIARNSHYKTTDIFELPISEEGSMIKLVELNLTRAGEITHERPTSIKPEFNNKFH